MLAKRYKTKTLILICLFCTPLFLFILNSPKDWAGTLIIFGTMFSFLISKEFLRNKKIFFSGLFVLIVHHVIAFTNAYIMETIGAEADAKYFHKAASLLSNHGHISFMTNGSEFYINFLAFFYRLFGDSHLLGLELSVLAFFLSMIIMLKLLNLIGQTKHQHVLLLMYSLLPTGLMFTSITLRESWQILFFMLIVYYSVKLRKTKNVLFVLPLICSMIGLSFWHNGFLAVLPFLVFITVLWSFKSKKKMSVVVNFFVLIIAVLLIMISLRIVGNSSFSQAGTALTSGNTLDYIEKYRSNSELDSGASYVSSITFSGPIGTLINTPIMFIGYMFTPYPWQIRGVLDIYAFSESVFRFILLICSFSVWKKSEGEEKSIYGFLLIMFILIELVWSLGTSNWGTAMRHHLVAYGILLIIGGSKFSASIKRIVLTIVK